MTQSEMASRIHACQKKLYAIARRMMGSDQDALDALSEAAYRACLKAGSLRDANACESFLCTIVVNCCRMALKKRKQTVIMEMDVLSNILSVPDETQKVDVGDLLNRLPKKDAQLLQMKYFAGLGSSEIGRALHMPESSVRFRLNRALSVLRKQLEEK